MFQVIECDEPLEIREGETEEDWILSQTLIERVKIDLPQGCVEATKQKPQKGNFVSSVVFVLMI